MLLAEKRLWLFQNLKINKQILKLPFGIYWKTFGNFSFDLSKLRTGPENLILIGTQASFTNFLMDRSLKLLIEKIDFVIGYRLNRFQKSQI